MSELSKDATCQFNTGWKLDFTGRWVMGICEKPAVDVVNYLPDVTMNVCREHCFPWYRKDS